MIVLDTHIWVWWVHGDGRLSKSQMDAIQTNAYPGIRVLEITPENEVMETCRKRLKKYDSIGKE